MNREQFKKGMVKEVIDNLNILEKDKNILSILIHIIQKLKVRRRWISYVSKVLKKEIHEIIFYMSNVGG